MAPTLDDYARWKSANTGRTFSLFDYAYAEARSKAVAADLFIAIGRMVWPELVVANGEVFLAEQFSRAKLDDLRARGMTDRQAQYWINLFSVDGLFQDQVGSRPEYEEDLAEVLLQAWSAKLRAEFTDRTFDVRIVRDDDVGDLCVVFTESSK